MSTWNHRVVRLEPDPFSGERYLQLSEVHYNEDGTPAGYGLAFLHGDTLEELQQTVDRLQRAVVQPILEHEDMVGFKGAVLDDDDEDLK